MRLIFNDLKTEVIWFEVIILQCWHNIGTKRILEKLLRIPAKLLRIINRFENR